jgi:hypothetical protein
MVQSLKISASLVVSLMIFLFSSGVNAQEAVFLPGTEDIPLMTGVTLASEGENNPEFDTGSVVFDTPEGRILNITAFSKNSPHSILSFYETALPQLGWIKLEKGKFQRETEILEVSFSPAQKGKTIVLFRIAPQSIK